MCAAVHRPVKGCRAVDRRCVDVGGPVEQVLHRLGVEVSGGLDERHLTGGVRRPGPQDEEYQR